MNKSKQEIQLPNKVFVCNETIESNINKNIKIQWIIIIAAENEELAKLYLKNKYCYSGSITWLMNAWYETIWTRDDSKKKLIQAKILWSKSVQIK